MNRVKYVPASARARELAERKVLIIRVWQGSRREFVRHWNNRKLKTLPPTVAKADDMAARRGWIRLSLLPPSERREYRRATAQVM